MSARSLAWALLCCASIAPSQAADPAPQGAISYFSGACPAGWRAYQPAAGRTIVPSAPEGLNRTVGEPLLDDEALSHEHKAFVSLRLNRGSVYPTYQWGQAYLARYSQPSLSGRGPAEEEDSELPLAKLNVCEKVEAAQGIAPAGMTLFFSDPVCPAGWSPFDDIRGRVLTGRNLTSSPGAFGSLLPLRDGEDRVHSHSIIGRAELQTWDVRIWASCNSCSPGWVRSTASTYRGTAEDSAAGLPYLQLQACSKDAPVGPQISRIVHGADFGERALAAGQHVTIFGSAMGPAEGLGAELQADGGISRVRDGVQVMVDEIPAPLFYVRDDQIKFQVPYEVVGRPSVRIHVVRDGVAGPDREVVLAAAAPALFAWGDDPGRAVAVYADGTLNSAEKPAEPGQALIFFATGGGQSTPPGITGAPAMPPYPTPLGDVELWIGGEMSMIDYAGAAPGYVGMMQINARMTGASGRAQVVLKIGGAETAVQTVIFGQEPNP
jgi:uncharacterized protein (TIGR03437 family)